MGKIILPLLCGGVIGLVAGVCAGPALTLRFDADLKQEALYRGQPTSFWIGQLQDHDQIFRVDAVQALEAIGPKDQNVVPALAGMLKDEDRTVRMSVVLALCRFGPEAKPAVPQLIRALQDRNRFIRAYAAKALGNIGTQDERVMAALISALHDETALVHQAALAALGNIDPGAKGASSEDRTADEARKLRVRQQAAEALERIERRHE